MAEPNHPKNTIPMVSVTPVLPPQSVTFSCIILGEAGLGKSTVLRVLWELHKDDKKSIGVLNRPTVTIDPIKFQIPLENQNTLDLTMIDTPGYGENIVVQKSFNIILNEIHKNFMSYIPLHVVDEYSKHVRNPLIHLCLYFLSTPRIKKADIEYINQLREYVNIIPIIAKANHLTPSELADFKKIVAETLKDKIPTNNIFAVVGTYDNRDYGWGKVEPWTKNSDLYDNIKLKSYVLKNFVDLKKSSVDKWKKWNDGGRPPIIKPEPVFTEVVKEKPIPWIWAAVGLAIFAFLVRYILTQSK